MKIIPWIVGALTLFDNGEASITYMNATGGNLPLSLYQQSSFFYALVSPTDSIVYDGPRSLAGKCNIMGYWTSKNSQQLLDGDFVDMPTSLTASTILTASGTSTSQQAVDEYRCKDQCTSLNGCGFDSCVTPKPDKKYREPLGTIVSIILIGVISLFTTVLCYK